MTYIRNLWYVAAWSNELGEAPIGRTLIGEPVVIWRKGDGRIVAMEDRCPHRHAPLSLGRVEDDAIRCMYHGLKFASDGSCLAVPGTDTVPPHCTARTFPVVEKWSWLWVWMGDPALADATLIPDAFGLDDPNFLMSEGALDYEADYQLINDNLTDLTHLDFVHQTTLGASTGHIWSNFAPKVTTHANGMTIRRWFGSEQALNGVFQTETYNFYHYILPGLFIMSTRIYPLGTAEACNYGEPEGEPLTHIVEQQAVTPIADGRTRYLFATGVERKYLAPGELEGRMAVVRAAFAEDRVMIEGQQKIWDLTPRDRQMAFIPQDRAPATFRRLIARRIAEEARAIGTAIAAE